MKALFISMPFASINRPPLGISILKTIVESEGHECKLLNLNIEFAKYFQGNDHGLINGYDSTDLIGEWIFSQFVFKESTKEEKEDYINFINSKSRSAIHTWREKDKLNQLLSDGTEYAKSFLTKAMDFDWEKYDLIGFSSSFQQNMASLALAKKIKEKFPNKIIIMGGGNCFGEMGIGLKKYFDVIDAFCIATEGEDAIRFLVRNFEDFKNGTLKTLPGFCTAHGYEYLQERYDINRNDVPIFDEYFEDMRRLFPDKLNDIWLSYEASRGCWWGEKSHCKFCGMKKIDVKYIYKDHNKVYNDLLEIKKRYGAYNNNKVILTDRIIQKDYFDSVFKKLADQKEKFEFLFEVKADLTEDQFRLLKYSGITQVQPGIESFSTKSLKLMAKGCTALSNIQFLKLCKEYNIKPHWNMLFGFVGESDDELIEQVETIKNIKHLPPPSAVSKIRLDRDCPYYTNSVEEGIIIKGPTKTYEFVYRNKDIDINEIGYSFDYDFAEGNNISKDAITKLVTIVYEWKSQYERSDC